MPRKKKEPKVSQKQKSVQAQAVKQTVKVVVGETKKAKRPYRRRAKPSKPEPPIQQQLISPIPQVIQIPSVQQQSPFAMFRPEEFASAIASQLNQRIQEQPVLAEAMLVPQEGTIAMTQQREVPSLAQMMSPVAKMEMEQTDQSLNRELARVRREQEDEMAKARAREPSTPSSPVRKVSFPVEAPPPPLVQPPPPPKRKPVPYVPKEDYIQMYISMTGEEPPKMGRDELATLVNKMRRSAGTKMQP